MLKPAGFALLGLLMLAAGCAMPARGMRKLQLGMTPDQVIREAGKPYTTRAAKVYEDQKTLVVWEYIARFALYPKNYWVMFENGRVVQWGEPGDFTATTMTDPKVSEYVPMPAKN